MKDEHKKSILEKYKLALQKGERFWPDSIYKDLLISLAIFIVLILLASFLGVPIEPKADPNDTAYIPRPEWYFLFLFQMLKYFPGKLEWVGTTVIPGHCHPGAPAPALAGPEPEAALLEAENRPDGDGRGRGRHGRADCAGSGNHAAPGAGRRRRDDSPADRPRPGPVFAQLRRMSRSRWQGHGHHRREGPGGQTDHGHQQQRCDVHARRYRPGRYHQLWPAGFGHDALRETLRRRTFPHRDPVHRHLHALYLGQPLRSPCRDNADQLDPGPQTRRGPIL